MEGDEKKSQPKKGPTENYNKKRAGKEEKERCI